MDYRSASECVPLKKARMIRLSARSSGRSSVTTKKKLAREVFNTTAVVIDPQSMFDVHVKRIHEYKRQLLNVMRVIHEYLSVVEDGIEPQMLRSYIFAGKAAPGYWAAKQIIKLINNVARGGEYRSQNKRPHQGGVCPRLSGLSGGNHHACR